MCSASKRIKLVLTGMVITLSMMVLSAGCSKAPTGFTPETGSADVNINLGRVGSLGKTAATVTIDLAKVIVNIKSGNDKLIADTIILTGNQAKTIMKTYSKLACDKEWTLTALTEDAKGVVVHSGGKAFRVEAGKTTAVSLDLDADYSMLKANFFGIPESINRCELLVNGQSVASETFVQDSRIGGTLQLAFDYLSTGAMNKITLNAYGVRFGQTALLYSADTVLIALPGEDKSYTLVLRWVGPDTPPSGTASIQVVIGQIGTLVINGSFDESNFRTDSLAVRAILDANGYDTMPVRKVACVSSGRIVEINMSNFGLTTMPGDIGKLTAIKSLCLGYNKLTSLPPEIGKCSSLVYLSLYHNPLTAFPKEIGQLGQLQTLYAYCCDLTDLPEEMSRLKNLTKLVIFDNAIRHLPSNIGDCSNLNYFAADYNQITEIPASIGRLTKLSLLMIYSNQLSGLPEEICQCRALTQINMSRNPIGALPDSIGNLTELWGLIATGNGLTDLPSSIVNLKKLGYFAMHNNQLCNLSTPIAAWLDSNRAAWTTKDDWRLSQDCGHL